MGRAAVEMKRLPAAFRVLQDRWRVSLQHCFDRSDDSCAWVARVVRDDGTRAVLKVSVPHMEAAHEPHGLQFWNGDVTVRLLEFDTDLGAMLLERCEPPCDGTVA